MPHLNRIPTCANASTYLVGFDCTVLIVTHVYALLVHALGAPGTVEVVPARHLLAAAFAVKDTFNLYLYQWRTYVRHIYDVHSTVGASAITKRRL